MDKKKNTNFQELDHKYYLPTFNRFPITLIKGKGSRVWDDQGNEYMISCISRSLNVHERNYSSPQGEMLAAVWAVKTFLTYLHVQISLWLPITKP